MPSKFEVFKEKVRDWETCSRENIDYGACDTEPHTVFQSCLSLAYLRREFQMPRTADDWQLFSNMGGSRKAATKLTSRLKGCIKAMNAVKNEEFAELEGYLKDYLWRVGL